MALKPPASEAAQQVKDVEHRSPIEVFLSGLQSVGSWKGFLGYAAAAGFVVWIGLFTNTSYLLVAAMLIAPFAGPAMNVAIATARGDRHLLQRSLLRYFAALAVTIVVAGALSLILQQEVTTSLMNATSTVSAVAVLLPLVAGAAGALNLGLNQNEVARVRGLCRDAGCCFAGTTRRTGGNGQRHGAVGYGDERRLCALLQLVGINLSAPLLFPHLWPVCSGSPL